MGGPIQYFDASEGQPERIGNVIGDGTAALAVIILALNPVFFR
jgi:hypothetical protein